MQAHGRMNKYMMLSQKQEERSKMRLFTTPCSFTLIYKIKLRNQNGFMLL